MGCHFAMCLIPILVNTPLNLGGDMSDRYMIQGDSPTLLYGKLG